MSEQPNSPIIPAIDSALPTKIAGIVFWGALLIGLLIAFIIFKNKENELIGQYQNNAKILQTVIQKSLEYSPDLHLFAETRVDLERNLQPFRETIKCDAIEVSIGSERILMGDKNDAQDKVSATLQLHPVHDGVAPLDAEISIFFPSIKQVLSEYRKIILFSIALLMMLFGLVLQYILQLLLTRPFLGMVTSAQKYAEGDTASRFDDTRKDEFGFLAKFINRALDTSAKQHNELSEALARVTNSEAALFAEKERMAVTLRSISEAVITTNANAVVEYLNPVAELITGWHHKEANGEPISNVINIVHEVTRSPMTNPVLESLKNNDTATLGEHAAILLRNDNLVSIEASSAPMRNDHGEVIGAVMVCMDVSHSRKLALQLSHQASHDSLTNLFNRLAFEKRLNHLLEDAELESCHALLYIDLDQFKIVNDTCGHTAGDELLRQLASLLHECIRRGDILARLGGDEFGVLLTNCELNRAIEVAEKIRFSVKEFRFSWLENTFEIGASIGVVEINAENRNATTIMSAADLACYAAKDGGRNLVHVYEPTDIELLQRHGEMHWTTMITQALEDNRFALYQQPICVIDDKSDTTLHWEILVRMKDKDGSIIPPGHFIPAAERFNKMHSIDRWVIYNVFSALADGYFPTKHQAKRLLSINLSGASLGEKTALSFIQNTGKKFNIDFSEICFEVTETVAISNLSKATEFILELKKLGCSFSLDDFGSGLSSFGYLKKLPVDYIKIDGSFVKDMASDPIDFAMVEAINQIGHVMEIKTIAEWVEDEQTLTMLKEIGVNYSQGYYTGKPVPISKEMPV
jgi:diguanylate cyclase (GGDEF)-like protein/PAS domain S-box-containing protein